MGIFSRKQRQDALADLFASQAGRAVLEEILQLAGVLSAEYRPGMNEYMLGRRSLALDILSRSRYSIHELVDYSMRREVPSDFEGETND